MKLTYYSLWALLIHIPISMSSQDKGQNYIYSCTMLHERDTTQHLEDIKYYDGLGRPFMNIQKGITPDHSNLVTLQEYDVVGRESKSWLPFVTSSDYITPEELNNTVSNFYNGDSRPYNESVYEASPLNRIVQRYGAGDDWADHPVSTSYLINTTSGELCCKLYFITDSGVLAQNGNYNAGELHITQTTDEDGNYSYIFVDKQQRQLLFRQISGNVAHDTYYVYDDFDNKRFVLPPAYQETPNLNLFTYQYTYDNRNRCVEKKLPGCDPIWYVYDLADNLIFSQTGRQRAKKEWTFFVYDNLKRVVITGDFRNKISRENLSDAYKSKVFRGRYINNCSWNSSEPNNYFGYNDPFEGIDYKVRVLSVNYYDTYDFLSLPSFGYDKMNYIEDSSFGIKHTNAKGLLTGSYIRQLDELEKGELAAHYYDLKGREIQKRSILTPYRHSNVAWTKYSFTGRPLHVKQQHLSAYYVYPYRPGDSKGENHQNEYYEYEYDHADRLVRTYHTHNNGERVLLSESVFDQLGRSSEKKRHNGQDTIKYGYNIRNWVASIESRGFEQKLFYGNTSLSSAFSCYNGNISSIQYKQNDLEYSFRYSYDQLNRLTSARTYDKQGSETPYHELYEYDKMGNITFLERRLNANQYDVLAIGYLGNRIQAVSKINPTTSYDFYFETMSYPNLVDKPTEYFYDANGNLIKNLDKDIVAYRYNSLNLPDTIQFRNGNQIINSYMADGRKVRTAYKTYMTNIIVPQDSVYRGDDLWTTSIDEWNEHYMYRLLGDATQYSPEIFMIQTPEGYVGADHMGIDSRRVYSYYYYVYDYLGNIRITRNSMGYYLDQSLEYYPSGVLFERSTERQRQPYMFGGKELVSMHGLNEYDFTARMQDPLISRFNTMDPLCEKYPWTSTYVYCGNNPIKNFDPDGKRQWPVNRTYNGHNRTHRDNFGEPRDNRSHQGLDMNLGSKSQDLGAPVYATHTGTVTRVAKIANGDKNAGGNRVQITSESGEVATFYMHLETIDSGVKVGEQIAEGDRIGTLGGSGFGTAGKYSPHLHYELRLDGGVVDPAISTNNLVDPQILLDGIQLPEVSITEQRITLTPAGIITPAMNLPQRIEPI